MTSIDSNSNMVEEEDKVMDASSNMVVEKDQAIDTNSNMVVEKNEAEIEIFVVPENIKSMSRIDKISYTIFKHDLIGSDMKPFNSSEEWSEFSQLYTGTYKGQPVFFISDPPDEEDKDDDDDETQIVCHSTLQFMPKFRMLLDADDMIAITDEDVNKLLSMEQQIWMDIIKICIESKKDHNEAFDIYKKIVISVDTLPFLDQVAMGRYGPKPRGLSNINIKNHLEHFDRDSYKKTNVSVKKIIHVFCYLHNVIEFFK